MTAPVTLAFLLYGREPGGVPAARARLDGFLAAYDALDAGVAHDLTVIFNGFSAADADALAGRLTGTPHRTIRFPEDQQDLAAYVRAGDAVGTPVVAFLNSHSRPLADGWLAALQAAAAQPDVGVAGATGSYESFRDAARGRQPLRPSERVRLAAWRTVRRHDYRRALREFPPFPNPHVRTNGFALRRETLAALAIPPLADKIDAQAFEAGHRGITRQVAERGLRAVVVGRGGTIYDAPEWPASRTFRSGEQENLLVSDNRTEQYRRAGAAERRRLAALAWGQEALACAP